ncbi:MAG: hypothetical protein LBI42_04045 [Chitinispirillales bacterium]|nr:hypothetical protein [Chitinispirillales bacterium]
MASNKVTSLVIHYSLLAITCLCLSPVIFSQPFAECADTSHWLRSGSHRKEILKQFNAPNITEECFCSMVSQLNSFDPKLLEDSTAAVFASRSVKGRFSPALFLCLSRNDSLVNNKKIWSAAAQAWADASVIPVYGVLASYSEGGRMPAADSLYRALDAVGMLDVHDNLRWARIKSLLGDYRGAASLYCKVIAADRRMLYPAMGQMGQLFIDTDSRELLTALEEFRTCALGLESGDTAYFRNWLADFYSRAAIYDKEIEILASLDIPSSPVNNKLADIARTHFSKRRYRHAANSAALAFERLEKGQPRSNAAFIAHQSYMRLGIRDSALVWLKRAELTDNAAKIQAAALNQETGHLQAALTLIDSLSPSLSKDTLIIRQYLFSKEVDKALNYASSALTSWRQHPREKGLWRARCFIFSGQPLAAVSAMDSVSFSAAWHGSAQLLRYKYQLQMLADDKAALKTWAEIEYLIFIEDLTAAVQKLKVYTPAGAAGEMIVLRVGQQLVNSGRTTEAFETLDLVKNSELTSEFLYFKAEVLYSANRKEEARAAAGKLLTDFPADVFAQKARILLSRID